MKFLDPTHATDTAQQPVKNGTLQFLQDSHRENLANLIRGLIGANYNPATIYRMWGGAITNLSGFNAPFTCTISPGAWFYNNEVFYMNGGPCYVALGQELILVMRTVQYSPASPLQADPVVFTDGNQYNVHNIRTLEMIGGTSATPGYVGSIFDTQAMNTLIETPIIDVAGILTMSGNYPNVHLQVLDLNLTTTGNITQSGSWPNISLNVPVPRNPVLCAGTTILTSGNVTTPGDIPGGNGGYVRVNFATDANPPLTGNTIADFYVMGSLFSIRSNNNYDDPTVIWSVEAIDATGFSIWIRETTSVVQELNLNWICFVK